MTKTEGKTASAAVKEILLSNPDGLREVIRAVMQEVLEAEMDEALGAVKSERTPDRLGYRSGHYGRTLITRVGKLELRVPQDRLIDDAHSRNGLQMAEPGHEGFVACAIVGKAATCTVAHTVGIEMVFRYRCQWYPSSSFACPLLVIRSQTPGIRSGPKRKTRAIRL